MNIRLKRKAAKKVLWVIGSVVITAVVILLMGSKVAEKNIKSPMENVNSGNIAEKEKNVNYMVSGAQNEQEAEKIADMYGMELVNFSYKIALYKTDKNPEELIKMGKELGYPMIARDDIVSAD